MGRVVLVLDTLARGGTERQMALLAEHWPGDAPELGLLVLSDPQPGEIEFPASLARRRVSRRRRYDPWLVPKVLAAARELDADLLLAPHRFSGLVAKLAGALGRIPVVVELRGRAHSTWKRRILYDVLDEQLLPLARRVVFNSETVAQPFRRRVDIAARIDVIPNAVQAAPSFPERTLNPQGPLGAYRLIAAGRLVPVKAFHLAIEALALLCGNGLAADLRIVGDGPLRPDLQRLAAVLGVGSLVDFLGAVDDPRPLLGDCDLLVHPAGWENTSNVILEAMAEGTPCVAFDVGGNREVLDDGQAGYLVDDRSATGLAAGIADVLSDPEEWARRSRLGARRARQRYGIDAMVQAHVDLVRGVLVDYDVDR